MSKTILITGASDGIGLETAKKLSSMGHHLIIHGRNKSKIETVKKQLMTLNNHSKVDTVIADLSELTQVKSLANKILKEYSHLDILINNAGVFKVKSPLNSVGLDVRFVVNTIAPYLLTKLLSPLLGRSGGVLNLSSAAQNPINIQALLGDIQLQDMQAYAQSKLGIRLWSTSMSLSNNAPTCISVNPGSLLASKMVTEGFGIKGKDLSIGANILVHLALDEKKSLHNGQYFDNDIGQFSTEIPILQQSKMTEQLISAMDKIIKLHS